MIGILLSNVTFINVIISNDQENPDSIIKMNMNSKQWRPTPTKILNF